MMIALIGENQIEENIHLYAKSSYGNIFFAERLAYTKPLMLGMNALNSYQTTIYQNFNKF